MRRPVIIEPFGRVCQDSPKDGSHLLSQVNSKHHGQAFRREDSDSLGSARVA